MHVKTLLAALMVSLIAAAATADLQSDFATPPDSARPWVYWFWLNGNISEQGITADLEAMKRVGIGGVLIMEVDQGVPVGPVDFMSDKWRALFHHVVSEADRLGLEVNMNNDAGWNGSGGPWIKPEQSMQKLVWTEVEVDGPSSQPIVLPKPESVAGFYRDICVLAFPTPGPYRIPDIKVKALFRTGWTSPALHEDVAPEMVIPQDQVVNLTPDMDWHNFVKWDRPGQWTIVRFGHTSTGVENAPAPLSGRGLECDKLSKEGIEANFNGMMAKLIEDAGPLAGKSLVATHIDSWENGAQNWTNEMRREFTQRRGGRAVVSERRKFPRNSRPRCCWRRDDAIADKQRRCRECRAIASTISHGTRYAALHALGPLASPKRAHSPKATTGPNATATPFL
jgi:hypothetical protein